MVCTPSVDKGRHFGRSSTAVRLPVGQQINLVFFRGFAERERLFQGSADIGVAGFFQAVLLGILYLSVGFRIVRTGERERLIRFIAESDYRKTGFGD